MHFHPTARKLYLNKLTLTVCLRNARTTYFIFGNDYLQPFQEGLKEEKQKKTRSIQKKKLSHQAHDVKLRHTDTSATSSRRIDVSTTLFGRPTPAGMLLKKVKAQPHMTSYKGISKSFEPNMERARNLDLFCFIFQRSPLPTPHTCPI